MLLLCHAVDKEGQLIVWDTEVMEMRQCVAAHEGAGLQCSVSPNGEKVRVSHMPMR
jgi:hypothetical protein